MFFSVKLKFLKYFLQSRHKKGHGIHSPFVYDLISGAFRNKNNHGFVCTIEKKRKEMLADQRMIKVNDLGAGSKRMKNGYRKVSDIARYSAIPGKYGRLLSNMAAEFGGRSIIEFGTSLGISTMYQAAACPDAVVYTMEGCPAISEIAKHNFSTAGIDNIYLMTGSFDDLLPEIRKKNIIPGLVFIDGNHRKEPVIRYFKQVAEMSDGNTVVIIDDIHSSIEMENAWESIKLHEDVTLTIDIFRMGMVFFREGISHFDYVIRY